MLDNTISPWPNRVGLELGAALRELLLLETHIAFDTQRH
jgi:hypothetical protein